MRQKATENRELTPAQERAIEALVAGRSVTAAAETADVVRQTVHGWLREDSIFCAAYNRARRECWEAYRGRLHALTANALDAVESAVKGGDARTALALLRGLGMLSGQPIEIGPESEGAVRRERLAASLRG